MASNESVVTELRKLLGQMQSWANNTKSYSKQHASERNEMAAEFHRGASEAFQRGFDELERLIAPPPAMNLQERLLEVAREFLYPNNCWPTGYSDWVNKEVNKLVALLLAERGKAQGEHEELKPAQPSETLPAGANILDEVSLLVSAVREFEEHSYVAGDPVGGCGECLRLFDRLIAQANTIEIAMRTESRAGQACSSVDREAALEEAMQLADPEKYTCEDSCSVGKVRDAIHALKAPASAKCGAGSGAVL